MVWGLRRHDGKEGSSGKIPPPLGFSLRHGRRTKKKSKKPSETRRCDMNDESREKTPKRERDGGIPFYFLPSFLIQTTWRNTLSTLIMLYRPGQQVWPFNSPSSFLPFFFIFRIFFLFFLFHLKEVKREKVFFFSGSAQEWDRHLRPELLGRE